MKFIVLVLLCTSMVTGNFTDIESIPQLRQNKGFGDEYSPSDLKKLDIDWNIIATLISPSGKKYCNGVAVSYLIVLSAGYCIKRYKIDCTTCAIEAKVLLGNVKHDIYYWAYHKKFKKDFNDIGIIGVYLKGTNLEHIQYGKLFPPNRPYYGEELIIVRQKDDKFYGQKRTIMYEEDYCPWAFNSTKGHNKLLCGIISARDQKAHVSWDDVGSPLFDGQNVIGILGRSFLGPGSYRSAITFTNLKEHKEYLLNAMRTAEYPIMQKMGVQELGTKKPECYHQLKNMIDVPMNKLISNMKSWT